MSNKFFKARKGLNLQPVDPSTITDAESGDIIIDSTDNNSLKKYNDISDSFEEVTGVGGSYNYIENGKFEVDVAGWTPYANTVAGIRPDDFGGTPAGLVLTRDVTENLIGDASLKMAKDAADRMGQGFYYEFDIEKGHMSTTQLASMIAKIDHANLADGDMALYIVSSSDSFTTSNVIESANPDIKAGAKDVLKRFQFRSDDTKGRLCFHVKSTNALAYDIYLDEIELGPKSAVTGAIISDWKEYVPVTNGLGTVVYDHARWRQVGSSVEIEIKGTTGTTTATEMQIGLPVSSCKSHYTLSRVGKLEINSTSNSVDYSALATGGDSFLNFGNRSSAGSTIFTARNGSSLLSPGEIFTVNIKLEVEGLSSNATSSEDYGSRDISVFAEGSSGATITANTENIDFSVVRDNSNSFTQVGPNGKDTFTAKESSEIMITGSVLFTASLDTYLKLYKNGVFFKSITPAINEDAHTFSIVVDLKKDDYINIRTNVGATLSTSSTFHHISIVKLASSQSIWETETVAARYTSDSGQTVAAGSPVIFENLVSDSHFIYNPITGLGTTKNGGLYNIDALVRPSSASSMLFEVHVNGTNIETSFREAINTSTHRVSANSVRLNKGDTFEIINGAGSSRTLSSDGTQNNISITRIGD